MKRMFSCIIISMLMVGCSLSAEQRAHRLIKDYTYKNIDDPALYESVDFGTLDTVRYSGGLWNAVLDLHFNTVLFGDRRDKLLYKNILGNFDSPLRYDDIDPASIKQPVIETMNQIFGSEEPHPEVKKSILRLDSIQTEVKKSFLGLRMVHSYRMNYSKGKKLRKAMFYFDRDLTRVDSVRVLPRELKM